MCINEDFCTIPKRLKCLKVQQVSPGVFRNYMILAQKMGYLEELEIHMYLDILVEEFPDLLPKLTNLQSYTSISDSMTKYTKRGEYKQEYFDQINLTYFCVSHLDTDVNIKHMRGELQ